MTNFVLIDARMVVNIDCIKKARSVGGFSDTVKPFFEIELIDGSSFEAEFMMHTNGSVLYASTSVSALLLPFLSGLCPKEPQRQEEIIKRLQELDKQTNV